MDAVNRCNVARRKIYLFGQRFDVELVEYALPKVAVGTMGFSEFSLSKSVLHFGNYLRDAADLIEAVFF